MAESVAQTGSETAAAERADGGNGRGARGEQRRIELLEAVVRLIAREGVAAVTHRAVAAEAGVTHRLTTYYFRTKEKMLIEAFRHLTAESLERSRAAVERLASMEPNGSPLAAAIDEVVDAVLGGLHAEAGGVVAELALVLEIPRSPELAADYAAWQNALEALLAEHARKLESDDPNADARLILTAIHGLQLERLGRPDRARGREELRALVERLMRGL